MLLSEQVIASICILPHALKEGKNPKGMVGIKWVAVWPSGKMQLSINQAPLAAVEAVEKTLESHFQTAWISSESERNDQLQTANERVVTYGVPGELAHPWTDWRAASGPKSVVFWSPGGRCSFAC